MIFLLMGGNMRKEYSECDIIDLLRCKIIKICESQEVFSEICVLYSSGQLLFRNPKEKQCCG